MVTKFTIFLSDMQRNNITSNDIGNWCWEEFGRTNSTWDSWSNTRWHDKNCRLAQVICFNIFDRDNATLFKLRWADILYD